MVKELFLKRSPQGDRIFFVCVRYSITILKYHELPPKMLHFRRKESRHFTWDSTSPSLPPSPLPRPLEISASAVSRKFPLEMVRFRRKEGYFMTPEPLKKKIETLVVLRPTSKTTKMNIYQLIIELVRNVEEKKGKQNMSSSTSVRTYLKWSIFNWLIIILL